MSAPATLDECLAARLPVERLTALAPLRRHAGVRVIETADGAWVTWDGEAPMVVRALLTVPGVVFYAQAGDEWRPLGSALPDFATPGASGAVPLDRALLPATLSPTPPPAFAGRRVTVTLVACQKPRPTSALRLDVAQLARWCETATTFAIRQLRGAACSANVWLRGAKFPAVPGVERFWGDRVLVPLGLRPEPDWPESPLRAAAAVDDDEILVLTPVGSEAIPTSAFKPLTRSAVRRLARVSG